MAELETLPEVVAEVKAKALAHAKGLAADVVELVPVALKIAAKQSATPVDDMVVAALEGPLKKALADLIAKI